jgi:predicted RNA-binding protein with PUA-like domain
MKYFLAKTEPETYSIDDLASEKNGQASWDGVRHPAAVKFMKEMEAGDKVFIYHTGKEKAIVGLAEVVPDTSRPDSNDQRSWLIDFKFIRKFQEPYVTLREVKESNKFSNFRLVTESRLSVMPVPENFIKYLQEKGLEL